jgi:hypothetical protein
MAYSTYVTNSKWGDYPQYEPEQNIEEKESIKEKEESAQESGDAGLSPEEAKKAWDELVITLGLDRSLIWPFF